MKAVIMAGGEGTRLRPLTSNQPKPMIPMANRPMMEHIVGLLSRHGITEIVVTVAFLADAVRNYFGDGSEFGVNISYATEQSPLGTAGSVLNAREELTERFLVISGDVVTDVDLSALLSFHEEKSAMATIALKSMENPLEFGIVITNPDGSVERFLEKPTWGQVFSDTVNTGIYVLEPEVFDFIPGGRPVDFSSEVFPALLEAGKGVYGCTVEGYWEDVGTLGAYLSAHTDVLDAKVSLDIPGFRLREGMWMGEGVEIDPSAVIEGPAVLGDYCRIGPHVRLGSHTVLGANVRVGADASLERVVVHDNCLVGPAVSLRGCVIGRSSDLRRGVHCEEGAVVGDRCRIGAHAMVGPGVKIYPSKTVEDGAVVNSSIIWEGRAARSLFGRQGVSGLANVDIGPELAVRLSMAYAATLPRGSRVVTSRDTSRAARVLKRAIMVGLNTSAINVEDLEAASTPATRFAVRTTRAQGGVTVRLASDDPQSVVIRFFDEDGVDIDQAFERKIERLLGREEFRRALAGEIGDLEFPARALERYTHALTSYVDISSLRAARFKLVVDYAYGTASFVMPNILSKLSTDVLAVNPYAATAQAISFDLDAHATRVAELVRSSGAHLGVVIEPGGELLKVIDDTGRILSNDQLSLAMLSLLLPMGETSRVGLPVSSPLAAQRLCEQAGAEVVWTKTATAHLMELAASARIDFGIGIDGGYVFPEFLPAFDATATLAKLLSLLAESGLRLSKVVDGEAPVHILHRRIPTPWEAKGHLMRSVVEASHGSELLLVDGVKVLEEGGWVLVLPDPEEPFTDLWVEGGSEDDAQERATRWERMLDHTTSSSSGFGQQ